MTDLDFFKKIITEAPDDAPELSDPGTGVSGDEIFDNDPIEAPGAFDTGDAPDDFSGEDIDVSSEDFTSSDASFDDMNSMSSETDPSLNLNDKLNNALNYNIYEKILDFKKELGIVINSLTINSDFFIVLNEEVYRKTHKSMNELKNIINGYLIDHFYTNAISDNFKFLERCKILFHLLVENFAKKTNKKIV